MRFTYPSNKVCPKCGTGGYVWYLDDSEYIAKCTNCGHYFREQDFPMCVLDKTQKPLTNADRIRSMSDEELADFLARHVLNLDGAMHDIAHNAWLGWLRHEVKEGE